MPRPTRGRRPARVVNEARILAAALDCFRTRGINKTTMEDVATSAGVGRQTVYRTFPTRGALLDAVALDRLLDMRDRMKKKVDAYPSLESAMVDGTIDVRDIAREDGIFMAVVGAVGDHGLERYLLAPPVVIREIMRSIWVDVFARSRERGELRTDLSDLEIADWFRFVNFTLLLREDLDRDEQKKLLRTFVLPALLPSARVGPPAN
ncbi:MAG TPA: TetR/AcrR family transcriptional regulator [Pseudonocardia sp.]